MDDQGKIVRFEGRIKSFRLQTIRYCRICGNKVEWVHSGNYRCPKHGLLDYRQTKRITSGRARIEAFDRDSDADLHVRVVNQLLETAGISLKYMLDRLRGLRKGVWLDEWKRIVEKVNGIVDQHYIQPKRAEIFNAILHTSGSLEVRSVSRARNTTASSQGELFRGSRFTEADEKSFYEVTRTSLVGYTELPEIWVETLVLHYKKKIGKDEIDIGIRAPLKKYGKAFHMWLRINGVHFYPVAPYREQLTGEARWVYRVYHTENWKQNLKKQLDYLRNLESRAVEIADAAKKISLQDAKKELTQIGVPPEEVDELLSRWKGSTLWDLVSILPDRSYVVALLKKHNLFGEADEE